MKIKLFGVDGSSRRVEFIYLLIPLLLAWVTTDRFFWLQDIIGDGGEELQHTAFDWQPQLCMFLVYCEKLPPHVNEKGAPKFFFHNVHPPSITLSSNVASHQAWCLMPLTHQKNHRCDGWLLIYTKRWGLLGDVIDHGDHWHDHNWPMASLECT